MSKKLKVTVKMEGNKKLRKEAFKELTSLAREDGIKFKRTKNKMTFYLTEKDLEG